MSGIEEAVETAAKHLAAEKKAKAKAARVAQAERCREYWSEQEANAMAKRVRRAKQNTNRRRRANIIEETE